MPAQQQFKVLELLPAKNYTATTTGADTDLQGYINPGGRNMKVVLDIGTVTGTNPTWDVRLQEGDTTSAYTDISGATFSQQTQAGTNETHFRTNKRYVRAVGTIGGTGTPTFPSALLLLVEKRTI